MGVRVTCPSQNAYALFDSVTGTAFGEVFRTPGDAEAFLDHLDEIGERDARVIPALELAQLRKEWEDERE